MPGYYIYSRNIKLILKKKKKNYIVAVKKIFRYLKETTDLKLKFGTEIIEKTQAANKARDYINNNYAGNLINRKFIINYVFFIN